MNALGDPDPLCIDCGEWRTAHPSGMCTPCRDDRAATHGTYCNCRKAGGGLHAPARGCLAWDLAIDKALAAIDHEWQRQQKARQAGGSFGALRRVREELLA